MKKPRLSVYLDPEMMAQLAELADQKQQPKSLIAEAAIMSFLTPDDADRREAALARRLDLLTRQGERLERDLSIAAETLALLIRFWVTAQVGDLVQDRRRDFAKDVGSPVRASMMAQPCFLAVEKNERMSAKSTAPSTERKPPEIFWRNFIMRPSRSA